jgi:hypothetical protein
VTPIGEPFEPAEFRRSGTGENDHDTRGAGRATPVRARPACRPLLNARRDGRSRR